LVRRLRYKDKFKKLKKDGWGGYPELTLKEKELNDIEYINYLRDLFQQAYDM
jgi:hypothetical protein